MISERIYPFYSVVSLCALLCKIFTHFRASRIELVHDVTPPVSLLAISTLNILNTVPTRKGKLTTDCERARPTDRPKAQKIKNSSKTSKSAILN